MTFKALTVSILFLTFNAYADCWSYASKKYGVEARLLQSIAQVESGMNPKALGRNNNGTKDYGLMQINSSHLRRLQGKGISAAMLKQDPCISILVGASILKYMFEIYGHGWEAVGAYNAGLSKTRGPMRLAYARKVWDIYTTKSYTSLSIPLSEQHKKIL